MIKKILISIAVVIVIAGVTLGIFSITKNAQHASVVKNTSSTTTALVIDNSKDYGACALLSISSIKSSLGDAATNLQASQNTGITNDKYFGSGVSDIASDSQTCIYAFIPGGNAKNGFNANNGFSVQNTVFTNSGGPTALITQMKQDTTLTSVDSLGDSAFYSADTTAKGPGAVDSFSLQVFAGTKATTYTINQPAESATFTADSAKAALISLAKSAKS